MFFASPWEFAIGLVGVVAVGLWFMRPQLRSNGPFRLVLIVAVAWTAVEVIVTGLLIGIFLLMGGFENF